MTKDEKDRLEAFAADILKCWMDDIRKAKELHPDDTCKQSWVRVEARATYQLCLERMVKRGLIENYNVTTGKITMRRSTYEM